MANIASVVVCFLSLVLIGGTLWSVPYWGMGFFHYLLFSLVYPVVALFGTFIFMRRQYADSKWINVKRGLFSGSSLFVAVQFFTVARHLYQILNEQNSYYYATYVLIQSFQMGTLLCLGGMFIGWIVDCVRNRKGGEGGFVPFLKKQWGVKKVGAGFVALVLIQALLSTTPFRVVFDSLFLLVIVWVLILICCIVLFVVLPAFSLVISPLRPWTVKYIESWKSSRGLRSKLLVFPMALTLLILITWSLRDWVESYQFRKVIAAATRIQVHYDGVHIAEEDQWEVEINDESVIQELARLISFNSRIPTGWMVFGCTQETRFRLYQNETYMGSFQIDNGSELDSVYFKKPQKDGRNSDLDFYYQYKDLTFLSYLKYHCWLIRNGKLTVSRQ